jgi:transcriptional regulator with XRE-family HTH domain
MGHIIHSKTIRTAATFGEHVKTWRLLLGLSAKQVCERAGISVSTLSRLENGDPGVNYTTFLEVIRSLGLTDSLDKALDPWESDLGRARARLVLPQRIRHPRG